MRYKVLTIITFFSVIIVTCSTVGISSKLDFGDSSPKLIGTATQYRSLATPYRHLKREEAKPDGDFDGIGVVCVSGGCNKTQSGGSKDSIQTDVVVHVKTSVDVNKNATPTVDDTPDVPVIVGTAGTNLDYSQGRAFNHRPLVVTDFEDTFSSARPVTGASVSPSLSRSFIASYPSYSTPTLQSNNEYLHTLNLAAEPKVDVNIPSYPSYSTPTLQSDVYVHKSNLATEPKVDINIKTLPPVSLSVTDDGASIKDVSYKANGIEVRVPYFEPSYHNHYFGENPPPQFVWYPKRPTLSDSVDYKSKATWKPSFRSNGSTHKHTTGTANNCPCKNQPNGGLQWFPNRRRYDDPGSHIDDKLAPLN